MNDEKLTRWRARLERAAALLSERLGNPPSLKELAGAAAVSPCHFHRIWRALTGETVSQTVLRLRLEASQALLQQDIKVEIEQRGEILVVALRREGRPYTNLNTTFGQVWSWAEATDILTQLEGIYGIPLDDPMSVPEGELRYDASLALGVATAPEPFRVLRLPAGDYARVRHSGSYDGLEAATQALLSDWLLPSGHEPADFPIVHHFINDPDQTPEDELATDILLPLVLQGRPSP